MEKEFFDQLLEAKRTWDEGNHSDDNLWANWKYEQAMNVDKSICGTFEWWESLAPPNSPMTLIERKVKWAEMAIRGANLKPRYTVVSSYFRSDGTHVVSHLRRM